MTKSSIVSPNASVGTRRIIRTIDARMCLIGIVIVPLVLLIF
jgi:hypothetical protein